MNKRFKAPTKGQIGGAILAVAIAATAATCDLDGDTNNGGEYDFGTEHGLLIDWLNGTPVVLDGIQYALNDLGQQTADVIRNFANSEEQASIWTTNQATFQDMKNDLNTNFGKYLPDGATLAKALKAIRLMPREEFLASSNSNTQRIINQNVITFA